MQWLIIGLTFVLYASVTHAQHVPPPSGINIDKQFPITLQTIIPAPCIAIQKPSAIILLPYIELKTLAKKQSNEGISAQKLLNTVSGKYSLYQCRMVDGKYNQDLDYVIARFLNKGQAVVIDNTARQPVDKISIRYFGKVCGALCGEGTIFYYFQGNSKPFMTLRWWIS